MHISLLFVCMKINGASFFLLFFLFSDLFESCFNQVIIICRDVITIQWKFYVSRISPLFCLILAFTPEIVLCISYQNRMNLILETRISGWVFTFIDLAARFSE